MFCVLKYKFYRSHFGSSRKAYRNAGFTLVPLQDFQQVPAMTESLTPPTYFSQELLQDHWTTKHQPNLPDTIMRFCMADLKDAEEKLQKADRKFGVIYKKHREAADEMDQIVKQMEELSKIACLPSATKKDKEDASATFNKYCAVSAFRSKVSNIYKSARNRRDNAYKQFKQASENMKVVKQRVFGEDTDSDSSDSDAP